MLRFERQPPGTAITRASLVVGGASAAAAGVLIVASRARVRGGLRRGIGGRAAGRWSPREPRRRRPHRPHVGRAHGSLVGRDGAGHDRVGRAHHRHAHRDRSVGGALPVRPVVLRSRTRCVAVLQRGGEPRHPRDPLRLGVGWASRSGGCIGPCGRRQGCPCWPRIVRASQVAREERASHVVRGDRT